MFDNYGFNLNDFIIKIYNTNKILSYNKRNGHIIFEKEGEYNI